MGVVSVAAKSLTGNSPGPCVAIGRSGFAATTAHVSFCDQQATAPYPLATIFFE